MQKILFQNKEAGYHYEILETFEAGIKLKGHEVKALMNGKGSLKGAYVSFRGSNLYLVNFYIAPYQEKNVPSNYDPYRERLLLLTKKEINYLLGKIKQKGITLIPLQVYLKNRLIKIKIALVRGLKKYEKRDKIKKREFERLKGRYLKSKQL